MESVAVLLKQSKTLAAKPTLLPSKSVNASISSLSMLRAAADHASASALGSTLSMAAVGARERDIHDGGADDDVGCWRCGDLCAMCETSKALTAAPPSFTLQDSHRRAPQKLPCANGVESVCSAAGRDLFSSLCLSYGRTRHRLSVRRLGLHSVVRATGARLKAALRIHQPGTLRSCHCGRRQRPATLVVSFSMPDYSRPSKRESYDCESVRFRSLTARCASSILTLLPATRRSLDMTKLNLTQREAMNTLQTTHTKSNVDASHYNRAHD